MDIASIIGIVISIIGIVMLFSMTILPLILMAICLIRDRRKPPLTITNSTPRNDLRGYNPTMPPSYDELLKRDEWRTKRLQIIARDGHRCRMCDSRHNLDVHHLYYSKYPDGRKVIPWNYPDDALITLCRDCHNKTHQMRIIKSYYRPYNC